MGAPAENSEAAEDARRFGFPEEVVAAIEAAERRGERDGVWPENWDIVAAFVVVSTQWRAIAMPTGHICYIGLDYAGARAGLDAAGIARHAELWAGHPDHGGRRVRRGERAVSG
jgi:hypothetical protein